MNPVLWVNQDNLVKNFNLIKSKTDSTFICPMVKTNAYGVGDTLVVGTLLEAGAKHFGVARVFEAEKLRRFFPNKAFEILVFNALYKGSIKSYAESDLTPVVGSYSDLDVLKGLLKDDLKKIGSVHLKFDLGMSRFGFKLKDVSQVGEVLKSLGLNIQGVCGHFPNSKDFLQEEGLSARLLTDLINCASKVGVCKENVHAPNSTAIQSGKFQVGLRPGIGLYGVSLIKESGLKGVLRLTSPVVSFNSLSTGDKVSYEGVWKAKEPVRIGVLPIGYADGLRRGLSNRIKFFLKGVAYSQVGAICMDYCMVNLGSEKNLKQGDKLTLFDETYSSLFEWAKILNTIPYELLTGLGHRIERRVF